MGPDLFIVSISCITFNQKPFIRKAIEGFLIQKTTFPIEVLIHDDASTDGTDQIIREYEAKYPDIIKPIYQKENQWKKGRRPGLEFNYPRAKGKYIAICEGDDYWTDPFKLQKQVDFLEKNPHCGMVYTDYDLFDERTKATQRNLLKNNQKIQNTFEDFLINRWPIPPCTWMFRASIFNLIARPLLENNVVGDLPLILGLSRYSKIAYIDENTAVYRVLEKSASHFDTLKKEYEFLPGVLSIQFKFASYFEVPENIILKIKDNFYAEYFISICLFGDKQIKEEAYDRLKKNGLNTIKHRLIFILTKFKITGKLVLWYYN
ncbi:MAG: glycosyltransferase [Bacteroidota bacterium]|nr:glycosyltransferase [Bacteroidota bacterium]